MTHDRYFLENVASEVVELSRVYAEGVLRVRGTYSKFLEGRELYMEAQTKMQEGLRNRVKTEIEWLRRGPKARATKAKARIDNAHVLIGKLAEVDSRMRTARAGIEFAATDRQTKRLIELEDVAIELGGREIVRGVNFGLTNGMKLGLVGPNGSGKTTMLRAMSGEIPASRGKVKRANSLRIVYFSQMREIDASLTLRRALAPDSDAVVYQDRMVHVASYAAKFLFTGEQLNQPVERLSGGERARVLIARLMLQPADVLMLDEPTNDLDIPTLEILEESLLEFKGALVLVTHDRYMLDRVSNVVLGLDGHGHAKIFADYSQWEDWKGSEQGYAQNQQAAANSVQKASSMPSSGKKKLSYLEQREFDGIEAKVDAADARMAAAHDRLEDPSVTSDAEKLTAALAEMEAAQAEHDAVYERWAELTEKAGVSLYGATSPFFITNVGFVSTLMSLSGSPGTAMTSAKKPGLSWPMGSAQSSSFAPLSRPERRTSAGLMPYFDHQFYSRACVPWGNGPTSEPTAKGTPAAICFLNWAAWKASICFVGCAVAVLGVLARSTP